VNRKEFFQSVASVGVLAALPAFFAVGCSASDDAGERAGGAAESQGRRPPQFKAKRAITTYTGHLSFSPNIVFPLLCPVREYQWLEGWQCEMIYSDSGVAEDNCIFKTAHAGGTFWSVSRYEPPKRIEFTTFVPNGVVTRLNLFLQPAGGGTDLQWTRIFTGLSEVGNESVGTWNTKVDAELTRKLEHYLRTGEMLREHSAG
jgi:hypothetical protein